MSKDDKLGVTEKLDEIAKAMEGIGSAANPLGNPWPYSYRIVRLGIGAKIPVIEKESRLLVLSSRDDVVDDLIKWNRQHQCKEWILTPSQADAVYRMWSASTKVIESEEISPVRWRSETGYTWARMTWDQSEGETPTWDTLLGRMTNKEAFRAFIGSLFFTNAKQHQYLWLFGTGGDGKSAISNFIQKIFGNGYASKQPKEKGDRFWACDLIGKRVVVLPDCNSQTVTTSGFFKSLTGGDAINVEFKGKAPFTTRLNCKFMLLSNEKPIISSDDADRRRMIYCEFTSKPMTVDPDFDEKLWEEGSAFITKCVKEYVTLCPNNESIKSNIVDIESRLAVIEEPFQIFFDEFFTPVSKEEASYNFLAERSNVHELSKFSIAPTYMQSLLMQHFPNKFDRESVRDWMERTYGIKKKRIFMKNCLKDTENDTSDKISSMWVYVGAKPSKDTLKPGLLGKGGLILPFRNS